MASASGLLGQFCVGALASCFLLLYPAFGLTEVVLHNFVNRPDGVEPVAAMVFDKSGNLYGTTFAGGSLAGTVFEISPSGTSRWTYKVIYTFVECIPGCYPQGALSLDEQGNLYGATQAGGRNNTGIIFKPAVSRMAIGPSAPSTALDR